MGGEPQAVFQLARRSPDNHLAITRADGKLIEGTFQLDLVDDNGRTMQIRNGRFLAEDRQY